MCSKAESADLNYGRIAMGLRCSARIVKDNVDLQAKHVMPLPAECQRKEGEPAMTDDLDAFKTNWAIFTKGSLSQLGDWTGGVTAGGLVLACLAPLPDLATTTTMSEGDHAAPMVM
ncbi:hypothetical protein OF83DRAFT_1173954 [Amylostereum chailletii]|nr:hypothetical protein OF83DRAFT_1173954 [Amylostereum chailletii]